MHVWFKTMDELKSDSSWPAVVGRGWLRSVVDLVSRKIKCNISRFTREKRTTLQELAIAHCLLRKSHVLKIVEYIINIIVRDDWNAFFFLLRRTAYAGNHGSRIVTKLRFPRKKQLFTFHGEIKKAIHEAEKWRWPAIMSQHSFDA